MEQVVFPVIANNETPEPKSIYIQEDDWFSNQQSLRKIPVKIVQKEPLDFNKMKYLDQKNYKTEVNSGKKTTYVKRKLNYDDLQTL